MVFSKFLKINHDHTTKENLIYIRDFYNFLTQDDDCTLERKYVNRALRKFQGEKKFFLSGESATFQAVLRYLVFHSDERGCKTLLSTIEEDITNFDETTETSTYSLYKLIAKTNLDRILTSLYDLEINESEISTLFICHKKRFTEVEWKHICWFEKDFSKSAEFCELSYEEILRLKYSRFQNLISLNEDTKIVVKQEPEDPGYIEQNTDNVAPQQNDNQNEDGNVRETLTQILNTDKGKALSVKSVVEHLVNKNLLILQQTDAKALKPQQRNYPSKTKTNENYSKQLGNILQPNDPTVTCTNEDVNYTDINTAVVEHNVHDSSETVDQDLVCAVASKVHLQTQQGQTLQMDLTCYWCNFCNYKSERKEVLLQHMVEHRFHCKYCKYQSFSRAAVIQHCTRTHEDFKEVAPTLKYCTYLPDILQRTEIQNKKRKLDDHDEQINESITSLVKTPRYDGTELLSMEVDEVDESGDMNSTSTNKIIIPSQAKNGENNSGSDDKIILPSQAKKSLPAPVKPSMLQQNNVTLPLPTNNPVAPVEAPTMTGQFIPLPTPQQYSVTPESQIQVPPSLASFGQPPATTGNLPVIVDVFSCQPEVEAAEKTTPNSSKPTPKPSVTKPVGKPKQKNTEPVTVSSGLCWNCGYCEFMTLNQSYLKIHLNGEHQGKPHKYVALLVSSKEEMAKIKESDASLWFNGPKDVLVHSVVKTTPKSSEGEKSSPVQILEPVEVSDDEETEEEKKVPVSYKCAHCNFSGPDPDKVKVHLKTRHMGCVMYILDMRAVKLRRKRYLFFCIRKTCKFMTKIPEEYVAHVDKCTPTSSESGTVDLDEYTQKSINLTKHFIAKTHTPNYNKGTKIDKASEYGCVYCSYVSNNNTRLKKHVLSNHAHAATAIQNLNGNARTKVNFCRYCLWETRENDTLGTHLIENHKPMLEKDGINIEDISKNGEIIKQNRSNEGSSNDPSNDKENDSVIRNEKSAPTEKNSIVNEDSTSNEYTEMSRESSLDQEDSNSPEDTKNVLSDEEEKDGEDQYTEVIGKTEYERALALYVAHNDTSTSEKKARPSRSAAVKAQIRNKLLKPPTLYKCYHCNTHVAFGTVLMKAHIRLAHKDLPLITYDLLKKEKNRPQALVNLCPSDKCLYSAAFVTDVINHAKNSHSIRATHTDLVMLTNHSINSPSVNSTVRKRKATPATGESYECLYCTDESVIFYSRIDIKKHLIDLHSNEPFLFRDCIARKLHQQSRLYMCHNLDCDSTFNTEKDYDLHLLAHNKSIIYECPKCSWYSTDPSSTNEHLDSSHSNDSLTAIKIDLDISNLGHVLKMVDGTVIKTER